LVLLISTLPSLLMAQQDGQSQKVKKKVSPSTEEMAQGIDQGTRYNVKKVLQANDPNSKFSGRNDNPELRAQFELERLKDPATGEIPEGIRQKELAYVNSAGSRLQETVVLPLGKEDETGIVTGTPGDQLSPFTNRGPFNVGGRTRALAIDINDENRILAGGVSGGMWLSTNQGTSWQRVSPLDQNPTVTAVVQDKRVGFRNTWYYSTGEASGASQAGRNGSASFRGNGIFKSTDNGTTWAPLPATVTNTPQSTFTTDHFKFVASMAIDPVNGDLYVASFAGILRSQDGGTSFQMVLPVANLETIRQLEVLITPGRVMYAAIPRHSITTAGPGNAGVYRSTTGNVNEWTNVTPPGFPVAATTNGRITLGYAPSNENILYAFVSGTSSLPVGHDLWKYTYLTGNGSGADGTWENRSANLPNIGGSVGSLSTQGGYDQYVKVHPNNENMIFVAGTNLYRSSDGFASNTNTSWIAGYSTLNNVSLYPNHHPDQHSIVFFPSNPNKVLTGHDGGLSLTNDITTSLGQFPVSWTSLNNGYLTTQVYSLSVGPGNLIMAGFQDNSTWATASTASNSTWVDQFSGDGTGNAINKNGTLRYVSAQNGVVFRLAYTDANDVTPNSFTNISPIRGSLFVTQFELDPNNDKLMYYLGANTVWRANNVTTATVTGGWNNLTNTTSTQILTAIGVSTSPANVVYVGSSGGRVFRLDNANVGNPVYNDVFTGKGLPVGNVSSIAVDPNNAMRAILVFSNYSIKSLWLTENGGVSWTDISGNLEQNPDGTGNGPSARWATVVGNNDAYLVGTSTGLYATKVLNGTATVWSQVDPTVLGVSVVEQMRAREDGLVVVGTHGNGLFSASFEVTKQPVLINQPLDNVSVLKGASPVVIPVGNVFRSTAVSPLAITVSVVGNDNSGLVTANVSGNDLTLTFATNATGTALITLKGTDTNGQIATSQLNVEVNPLIDTYPFVTDFATTTLPFGYKVSGNMDWLVRTGPPPTANTGPSGDHTQANGSGNYIYTETSGFRGGAVADFFLPAMDISSLTAPGLSFYYHMFGATTGRLEVYVRNVATNTSTRVLQITGQQQLSRTDPYKEAFIPLAPYVSVGKIQVFFRGVRGTLPQADGSDAAFTGDMAIDDIVVQEGLANDVGVSSVQMNTWLVQSSDEVITAQLTNFGTSTKTGFDVSYQVGSGAPVVESFTGTLAPNETKPFVFATKLNVSTRGVVQVTVSTQLTGDGKASNNSAVTNSTVLPTATLPYKDSFETNDGGWTPAGSPRSWALGVPAGAQLNAASDGTKAWVTNLTGNYPNNERSFVLSPVYQISGLDETDVTLDLKYRIEDGWDGAALQVSTDVGATWANVGSLNSSPNWYNKNLVTANASTVMSFSGGNGDAWTGDSNGSSYLTATHKITGLTGKTTLLLRMVFASDVADNLEGIAFDNVRVGKSQTITFDALPEKSFGAPSFNLNATATSNLPVSYSSSNPAVATINGNTVTIVGVGQTTITASQSGNSVYFAAPDVAKVLTVVKANQTITFGALGNKTVGDAPFDLTGSASSALTVSYQSSNLSVATITGSTVTIVGAGQTLITASQEGNMNYNSASSVEQSLTVKQNQTITFATLPDKTIGDSPIALSATTSSGLTVVFESLNDKATINGSVLTLAKVGSATVRAKQNGNDGYNAAPNVDRTFCINPAKPTIVLSGENTESPTLTSSATSGNQWYLDGTAITGATNSTHAALLPGVYTVKVILDGCTSQPSSNVALVITGDIHLIKNELVAYPNPTSNELNLVLGGFESRTVDLALIDMNGKIVTRFSGYGGETVRMDVSHLSVGNYIVKATQNAKQATVKFNKK